MNRVKPDASKVENVENVAAYILFSSLCIAVIIKRLNSDLQTHKSDKSTFLNSFSNVEMFYTEMLNSYTILAILRKDTWFIPKITIAFSKEMLRALTFTGLLVPIKLLRVPLLLTIDQLLIFCLKRKILLNFFVKSKFNENNKNNFYDYLYYSASIKK